MGLDKEAKNFKTPEIKKKKNIFYIFIAIPIAIGLSVGGINEYDNIQKEKHSEVMSSIESHENFIQMDNLITNTLTEFYIDSDPNTINLKLKKISNNMTNNGFMNLIDQIVKLNENLHFRESKESINFIFDKNKIICTNVSPKNADTSWNYTIPTSIIVKNKDGSLIKQIDYLMNIEVLQHKENGKNYFLINKISMPITY